MGARMAATDPIGLVGMTLLDRYTIVERLGGGGMSVVYVADDRRLLRRVSVKVFFGIEKADEAYQTIYEHFVQEAFALSQLTHPNTLRIYDFGYLDGGRPFQISEFLDGGNLEQHLRARGAMKPSQALAILERMTGAVAEAHGHSIIHRDIKSSNILFSRVGELLLPKLADFGIARCDLKKQRPGEPDETIENASTIPLFSPRWAAPEQLAGTEEGPFTDVYALGLVAVHMLVGRAPFDDVDDVRATFNERVRGDDYMESRLAIMGFDKDVRTVLLRALASNPKKRTTTANSFLEQLTGVLGGVRSSLPPPVAPRPRDESITLEVEGDKETQALPPPEKWHQVGRRKVRVIEVHEKLDLRVPANEMEVRFRVTLVPTRGNAFRMHLKGLNCFVAHVGMTRPSPAISADDDGSAEFVSMTRARLGSIRWSFGKLDAGGRRFQLSADPSGGLVIPSPEGGHALLVDLGPEREVIVICRRQ